MTAASVAVVVIGAGQAGLSAAYELSRRGLVPGSDLVVLDADDGPGGAWRHRWDALTLGATHRVADLPGMRFGAPDPSRPAREVVADYYRRYEEHFGLRVRRPVRVTAVRRPVRDTAGSPLIVETEGRSGRATIGARIVISAAGTWSRPFVPHVPGIEAFRGRTLHTVDFTRAEDFAGARVVVVGGGLSAVQFLLQLAPVARATVWSTRRPPNFTARGFDAVWGAEVEQAVDRRTAAGLPPASVVRTTGIPPLPEYLQAVEHGVLVSRGPLGRIERDAVVFGGPPVSGGEENATAVTSDGLGPSAADRLVVPASWQPYPRGTRTAADVIFWNTGFRAELGHLAPLHLRDHGGGVRMAGRVEVAAEPRVLLVGYGSSASTLGATRAGREAARRAVERLAL